MAKNCIATCNFCEVKTWRFYNRYKQDFYIHSYCSKIDAQKCKEDVKHKTENQRCLSKFNTKPTLSFYGPNSPYVSENGLNARPGILFLPCATSTFVESCVLFVLSWSPAGKYRPRDLKSLCLYCISMIASILLEKTSPLRRTTTILSW